MKYLGIDYGKSKIGLAISEGILASPLKIVSVHSLSDALVKIDQVINGEQIDQVVIGVPDSGQSLLMIRKFIDQLKKRLPVVEVDETLTTQLVQQQLRELKVPRGKRAQDDALAAAMILQEYLDSH